MERSVDTNITSINATNSSEFASCEEYRRVFTAGLQPYQILAFTVPRNDTVWTKKGDAWYICFYVYIAVMSILFLKLAFASIFMIVKKDCIRLPTKTFFAIYTTTAVLGFSRALCLILDPLGLIGYISDNFPEWFILSRTASILGFPSLVAGTTLMILTLVKVAKAAPGKQWYHKWRYVILIVIVPYAFAFIAEIISNFVQYPATLIVIVCELFFASWGFTMCLAFLFAGNRLLRQVRLRGRKTVRISAVRNNSNGDQDMEAQMASRHQFASREQQRHHIRTRRIARKITIITYVTSIFMVSFSALAVASSVMMVLLLFDSCLGFRGQGSSEIWLAFELIKRINEVVLSYVLLYSITDITAVMKIMCGKSCMKQVKESNNDRYSRERLRKHSSQVSILSNRSMGVVSDSRNQAINHTENLDTIESQEESEVNTGEQYIQTYGGEHASTVVESVRTAEHRGSSIQESSVRNEFPRSRSEPRQLIQIPPDYPPPQYLIIAQTDQSASGSESVSPSASVAPTLADVENQIESIETETETVSRKSTKREKETFAQRTIATQTVEIVDCPVQTEPALESVKPVPKPRKSRPKKSKNQIINEQRIAALRQAPTHVLNSLQDRLTRKRTI